MELIKDYDLEVHYHPGKANVVADALSRKTQCNCIQCGFASCEIGNKLTDAEQWAKIDLVREISEEVWG